MSVVAVFSAKGAPGATTAAMAFAALWPRPVVLADCDPDGGDIALRLPRPDGGPLDLSRGMLSLLPRARRSLTAEALLEQAQDVLGGGQVLAGLSGPEQAAAGGQVWQTIAGAFADLDGHDVIVDAGRLATRSPVLPLAAAADVAVCVLRTTLSSTYASRARLRTLVPALQPGAQGPAVGIVVRAEDRREANDAAQAVLAEFPDLRNFGFLASDASGAGIFDGRPVSRPERTLLVRSAGDLLPGVLHEVDRRRRVAEREREGWTEPVLASHGGRRDGRPAPSHTEPSAGPGQPTWNGPPGPPQGSPGRPVNGAAPTRSQERHGGKRRFGRRRDATGESAS